MTDYIYSIKKEKKELRREHKQGLNEERLNNTKRLEKGKNTNEGERLGERQK